MFKNMSIKSKIVSVTIGSFIIVMIISTIQSIQTIKQVSQANIQRYKQEAYKKKEVELNNYISIALKSIESYYERTKKDKIKNEVQQSVTLQMNFLFSVINAVYEQNKDSLAEGQLQEKIKNIIKNIRYGKSGYFWINDFNYDMVMHPIKPNLTGKNFKDNPKVAFVQLGVDALKKSSKDSAYIQYSFFNPKTKTTMFKYSIVKVFKPYNWIIGTGAYIDGVTEKMQSESLKVISKMRYGKSGYFWINDTSYNMVMHPIKPELIGKNFKDNPKVAFVQLGVDALKKSSTNRAMIKYSFFNPATSQTAHKMSIVALFKPWNWVIGTGAYTDDIEKAISKMEAKTNQQINSMIINIVILMVVLLLIISLLNSYIVNKYMVKPMNKFQVGLLEFFKYLNKEVSTVSLLDAKSDDEIGSMAKVLNENIVKTKELLEQDQKVIDAVKQAVETAKTGLMKQQIDVSTSNQGLEELKVGFNELLEIVASKVCGNLNKISTALESYGKLDFTHRITGNLGEVSYGLNNLAEIINKMLVDNKSNGMTLQNSADMLLDNVSSLSSASNEAAASLEETAAALEEITSNITNNTDNVVQMASHGNEVKNSVSTGEELATQTTTAMDEINVEVTAISDAIGVIDQIAFQTNILSLNAAVEAATAGEAGKGFAVVAQEVRNLASRSAEAANEIKTLVENARTKADNGKKIADNMIDGYNHLNDSITKTLQLIADVERASKEQLHGIEQINNSVSELDQQTQQNASVANATNDVALQTQQIAHNIVDDANEKEFIGKDQVKAKEIHHNSLQTKDNSQKQQKVEQPTKPIVKPVTKSVAKPIVAISTSDDDEWESF